MPMYRVEVIAPTVLYVEAENPFMAAIAAVNGDAATEVRDVRPQRGRLPGATKAKPAPKKRRPLSPEARAKLSQNLVKARAARAAKAKAAKKKRT